MHRMTARQTSVVLLSCLGAVALPNVATSGNGANFVLYNQEVEERGATEANLYSDFANVGGREENYSAQLLEIEHGVTDTWTAALHFEAVKLDDEYYAFGSFRFENRVRLFRGDTLLNPVLYVEYELEEPESRYLHAVTGRTDGLEENEEERTEHALETRLILGHDFSTRLNVAFNWINEVDFHTGDWKFGYVAGLNLITYKAPAHDKAGHGASVSWAVETMTLGAEVYGGLGDTELGLTLDPDVTHQYAGINLRADLQNHVHVIVGGAFGMTEDSEDSLLRLSAGYEFD